MRRKLFAAALALATIVSVSGCSLFPESPRDLTEYLAQEADWSDCDTDLLMSEQSLSDVFKASEYDCATILVPAKYTGSDDTENFQIQMMRIPAANPDEYMGAIFINPGGPGESGVEQVQWSPFPEELHQHYDIIGFDPRGVGSSNFEDGTKIHCSDHLDYISYFKSEVTPANTEEAEANIKANNHYLKDCAQRNPDWWTLSTTNVVDDLEIMRAVVTGKAPLNFIGSSYGTTIAGTYVSKYPKHVGKIVFDSPTALDNSSVDSALADAKEAEGKLTRYLVGYARYAKITVGEAWQRLLKIRKWADDDKLIGFAGLKPVPGDENGNMISSEALLLKGIFAMNYLPEDQAVSTFTQAMDALYTQKWNGQFELYALWLDGYDSDILGLVSGEENSEGRNNSFEIMTIVNTMDYSPLGWSEEEQNRYDAKYKKVSPKWNKLYQDPGRFEYKGDLTDMSWEQLARDDASIPDPPAEPPVRTNTSGKKVLIIGSTKESVTPFVFAKETAKAMKSPLISVDSATHAPAAGYDIPCLNKILIDYFVNDKVIESQSCPGA
ncbi:MAG: hypothetical protein RLZ71_316 [Actinomycetota bacterium]